MLDGYGVRDAQVLYHSEAGVIDVLDVERDDLEAHALHVRERVLLNLGRKGLAVVHDLDKTHTANDLAQVALENVHDHLVDVVGVAVKEILGSPGKCLRNVRDLNHRH